MAAFGVVIGDVVADFEPGFGQSRKAAAVEQFGFKAAPKRFGVGVVVTVAAPAHALPGTVFGEPAALKRVAVYWLPWSECTMSPAGGRRTTRARRRASHQVFGHGLAHVPADDFARAAVEPDGQVQPAAALPGQLGDVAHPDPVGAVGAG
jgi:hypothetical protein